MEPVKGFLGRYLRRKLIEMEISSRARSTELVKIIDWIPRVWHHLNRFLETHSSSDVTIGRRNYTRLLLCHQFTSAGTQHLTPVLCGVQDLGSSSPVPWMWTGPGFGSRTCGTTPSSPTCWRLSERACR